MKALGRIISINLAPTTGEKKRPVLRGHLIASYGLAGDAHGGTRRQVSLLGMEGIEKMREKGLDVGPGDFAENITTMGIELHQLPVGTRLSLGTEAVVEITDIGKTCHRRCAIYELAGDCIMPRQGVFARVVKGGLVEEGDPVVVMDNSVS